jgi:hypothetical protein
MDAQERLAEAEMGRLCDTYTTLLRLGTCYYDQAEAEETATADSTRQHRRSGTRGDRWKLLSPSTM